MKILYSKEQNKRIAELCTSKSIDFLHLTRTSICTEKVQEII